MRSIFSVIALAAAMFVTAPPSWAQSAVEGSGSRRTIAADVDWTFPLEFAEVVWGDGQKIDRQIIRVTDLPPLGNKRFAIPFDATGKKWVRFAIWDSAGNGAFVQPIWVEAQKTTTSAPAQ